jgi:hypothetical protein
MGVYRSTPDDEVDTNGEDFKRFSFVSGSVGGWQVFQ